MTYCRGKDTFFFLDLQTKVILCYIFFEKNLLLSDIFCNFAADFKFLLLWKSLRVKNCLQLKRLQNGATCQEMRRICTIAEDISRRLIWRAIVCILRAQRLITSERITLHFVSCLVLWIRKFAP